MKVAIYCRVSRKDQSLEQQRKACVEYCGSKEWEYEVFEEKTSGAKATRPQLDYMMQLLRAGQFQHVIVWKLDRLGRSFLHLIQVVEEFKNKGIGFICVTQGFDTNSIQGKFFLSVMAAVAELEREMIRERTQLRIDTLKEKGTKLGRPKGSKDKGRRRKSGYVVRWAKQKGKQLTPQEISQVYAQEEDKNKE